MHESSREITLLKSRLRKRIRTDLNALTSEQIQGKSLKIGGKLFTTEWWQKASWIFGFITISGEVETKGIIQQAFREQKKVAIPRIEGNNLAFYIYQGGIRDLVPNRFGILEPDPLWLRVEPSEINKKYLLILTPGIGFDRLKQRLGRGKGFYDRFLRSIRGEKEIHSNKTVIGLSFTEQLVPRIPVSTHDQPVDGVITDLEIIY